MIDKEKLESLMQESRVVGAADNVLFPMIKQKIQQRIILACSKFVGGETQFIGDIAYINGLLEIEQHLKKMITAGNKANFELNKENNN